MLTDTQLKNLKPTGKLYKLVDRDGLYVAVTPSGVVSFRYDYRLNGRRETLVLGQYGPEGLTLGEAREKLIGVKREIAAGKSPAKEKQRSIQKSKAAKTFGEFSTLWLSEYRMADSTRDMRKSVIDRDIEPEFGRRLLKEIGLLVYRLNVLIGWLVPGIPLAVVAYLDGHYIREIRKFSFVAQSPIRHKLGIRVMWVALVGLSCWLLIPVPLPALIAPALTVSLAYSLWLWVSNLQKRL